MADLYSTYLTNYGDGVGKTKEKKFDQIALAVQASTPWTDAISRVETGNTHFVWLEEEISTGLDNAQKENAQWSDLADNLVAAPSVGTNSGYVQTFVRGYDITDTQELAVKASVTGSNSEESDAAYSASIGLKTDIERALLSATATSAGTGTASTGAVSTSAKLGGAFSQIDASTTITSAATNNNFDIGTAIPTNDADTTGGTLYHIDSLTRKIWENGGYDWDGGNNEDSKGVTAGRSMVLMNANHVQGFNYACDLRPNHYRTQSDGTTLAFGISFKEYTTSFGGTFMVGPSKFILGANASDGANTGSILIANPQNWATVIYDDVHTVKLGRDGLNQRTMVTTTLGQMHRSKKVSAAYRGLTKSGYQNTAA